MSSAYPLFYKKVVPLSKEQHGELHIEPVEGYGFARETNSLFIAAVEFAKASKEYPIVFGTDKEGVIFPTVLLGLKNNQNLFVNGKGTWNANYIPAYARRYPFILATHEGGESDQFAVCIDESYPGFNIAKEGTPIFNNKGEHSDILKQAVEFLKDYQGHVQLTRQFCENLSKLDLLEPMQANVELKNGEKLSIGGFRCVNRGKLNTLKPAKLADLLKTGQLELIFYHLSSLTNVESLTAKLS